MFKKTKSLKENNHREENEQCHCDDNNEMYKIIENYRSILDRKQEFISSWKVFDKNGQIRFTHGTQFRKGTDAFVIRSSKTCLINPWYKRIEINQHLLSILKQNQCYKIFEIVLLECHCLTSSHGYELAIIECPCLQQLGTYCTYCRLILTATDDQSNISLPIRLLKDFRPQTNISFPLDFVNKERNINDSFYSRSGLYQHQRTAQSQVESEQILHCINEYEIHLITTKELTTVPRSSQVFDVGDDSSLSETKSIALLQHDDIQQCSSNSSLSLHFFEKISTRSQNAMKSNENLSFEENTFGVLTKYITRGTQTKLFAILLPQSPLSEMKHSKIEARTLMNVSRTCQVNTLSYLIKTNESPTEVQHPREGIRGIQRTDHSSTTPILRTEARLTKEIVSEEQHVRIKSLMETKHQILTDRKHFEHEINVPTIEFQEDELLDDFEEQKINLSSMNEYILTSPPLKCINACDAVDLDEPNALMTSFVFNDDTISTWTPLDKKYYQVTNTTSLEPVDSQLKLLTKSSNNSNIHIIKSSNNNSEQLISDQSNHSLLSFDHLPANKCQIPKICRLKTNAYRFLSRKRRRHRNKNRACSYFQHIRRRKTPYGVQLSSVEQHSPSFLITTDHRDQFEYHTPSTQINTIDHSTSFIQQQQQSIIKLHLNYKVHDHTIVVRASKNSTACKQLQTLLNNHDTSLEQLIDSQLILTCNDNYRSVCILIDDQKQSEQYRSSFLHYIHTTLSNTLKKIFENSSIQMTCMNLVFFNNSLCDVINMQRLRLIDTGKKIFLLPSCEITLRTSDDIDIAMNRLNTNMPFAHQIFIINFHHKQSSLSGSFLFLHLAPICSIRRTGLLTNLNSSTYSVLNLIRQLSNGQLFNHNTTKRYLLNDYSLNRLLKSYLFSSYQTMTVLSVKPKTH